MKVLIADKFQPWGIDALKSAGCEVQSDPALQADALRDAIRRTGCQVLVVRSTRVSAEMFDPNGSLDLVVRAGAGVNTIDVDAASKASILVANCPGKNAVAVAELTLALILALDRRIVDNVAELRAGTWNKKEYSQARGLKGRTLGVIGLGTIGHAVVERAKAFDMKVAAWSRSLTDEIAEELEIERCDNPADVATRADFLTVHLAAAPETKKLIGADVFNRLKPGSYVINTARHDVLDYDALAKAIKEKNLRVGLDVYPGEPATGTGEFTDAIINAGGVVYGTHHIGASTDQAQDAIAAETVRIVKTFAATGVVLNCVNLRGTSPDRFCLRVRHLNRPGVLSHVLSELSHAGINVEEMQNSIASGAAAACAQIHMDAKPDDATLKRIHEGCDHVLAVSLTESSTPNG